MLPRDRHGRAAGPAGRLVLLVLGALVAVACGGDATPVPPPEGEATYPGAEDERLSQHAETARQDLAGELGVEPEDVRVVRAESITWNNGALGCEQPDQAYTQALVEGYRIELEHAGTTYHYHGREGEPPFHCPEPTQTADAAS